jgi:hypothetical protein
MTLQDAPPVALDVRAAELKAQLLKKREQRISSGLPSAFSISPEVGTRRNRPSEFITALQEKPATPSTSSDERPVPSGAASLTDADLNNLLSEGQAAADAITVKKENIEPIDGPKPSFSLPPVTTTPVSSDKRVALTKEEYDSVRSNGMGDNPASSVAPRAVYNGDPFTTFSRQTHEERKMKAPLPPTGPKESELSVIKKKTAAESTIRKSYEDQYAKTAAAHAQPNHGNTYETLLTREDGEIESMVDKAERKHYGSNGVYNKSDSPRTSQNPYRNDDWEGHKRHDRVVNENPPTAVKVPTLDDLIAVDEDLREWLIITRWHEIEYRSGVLRRRRALAALEEQRQKLLEEELAEGGIIRALTDTPMASLAPTAMAPPPGPTKTLDQDADIKSDHNTLKRRYSDANGSPADRTKEQSHPDSQDRKVRPKREDDERGRSNSDSRYDRHDNRSPYRNRSSGRDYGYGRERSKSPGRRTYENRPPARIEVEDFPPIDQRDDPDDWKARRLKNDPPFYKGNHQSHSFEPHHNERGRGRGRGGTGHLGRRDFHRDDFNDHGDDQPYVTGSNTNNGPKKWDRGDKGGQ